MLSLTDFITKWDGKGIDFDGYYGDQCVDLMNQYCVEVLGIANPMSVLAGGTAYEIYQNYNGSQFTKIANTPTGVPSAGDILFFEPNIAGVTGPAGHVSVFITGDVNNLTSFDQNYPTGSLCHKQAHSYAAVAGWLHLKATAGDNVTRKSSFFDQIWLAHAGSQANTDQVTQQQVTDFITWLNSNVKRAGEWDQLCGKLGITGDTNQVTIQQILDKETNITAQTKLNQIKTIIDG